MIDRSQLSELVDERHSDPPDPIPTFDERRVLTAAQVGTLQITSGGKAVMRAVGFCATAPRRAYDRCLSRNWIRPDGHHLRLTDAGAAALTRRHR